MLEKVESFNMNRVIDEFDEMTRNAGQVQRQTLKEILEKNKAAIYLQNCGLDGNATTDPEAAFKANVPLVTDADLEPYIKRMVDGDSSPILTGHPVPAISLRFLPKLHKSLFFPFLLRFSEIHDICYITLHSSGTSQGRPKFVPFTDELMENTLQLFRTAFAFRNRYSDSVINDSLPHISRFSLFHPLKCTEKLCLKKRNGF